MADSAYVQKAVKKLPYSVTPIGDIALYRKQREEFEAAWDRAYAESREHKRKLAKSAVEEQSAPLVFDEVGKAEIEHRAYRNGFKAPESVCTKTARPYVPEPSKAPAKGLIDRFKDIWSQMWTNAFRAER